MTMNSDTWENETKGLLLIDGSYNTILIPVGTDELETFWKNYLRGNVTKYVRINKTKTDLNNSIREYLNKTYVNKRRIKNGSKEKSRLKR